MKQRAANPPPRPNPIASALADVLAWLDAHDANKNPDDAQTFHGEREIGADSRNLLEITTDEILR